MSLVKKIDADEYTVVSIFENNINACDFPTIDSALEFANAIDTTDGAVLLGVMRKGLLSDGRIRLAFFTLGDRLRGDVLE